MLFLYEQGGEVFTQYWAVVLSHQQNSTDLHVSGIHGCAEKGTRLTRDGSD